MFFSMAPREACLNDVNQRLVDCYRVVRDDVEALLPVLETYRARHSEQFFYEMRDRYNDDADASPVERAAMLIYLNKTGFNGLYRENSRGAYNVPFGRYRNPSVFDATVLRADSQALQGARLESTTFDDAVRDAGKGDFVYFDPPYQPVSRTAYFTAYTRDSFGVQEQERLAHLARALCKRGCLVMLSNSDAPLVRRWYADFHLWEVRAPRAINCQGTGRGAVTELVITNYLPTRLEFPPPAGGGTLPLEGCGDPRPALRRSRRAPKALVP